MIRVLHIPTGYSAFLYPKDLERSFGDIMAICCLKSTCLESFICTTCPWEPRNNEANESEYLIEEI